MFQSLLFTRGRLFHIGTPCWPLHTAEGGGPPCHTPSWVQSGCSPGLNGTILVPYRAQTSWHCVSLLNTDYMIVIYEDEFMISNCEIYTLMSNFSTRYSQWGSGGVRGACIRPCRGDRRERNRTYKRQIMY